MKINFYATIIYALLVGVGGIIGFLVAGSEPSLWMGITVGLILLLAAYTLRRNLKVGLYTVVTTALLLTFFFGYRYAITDKIMPAGLMMFFSVIMVGISFATLKFNEE